jgi:omega-6 fatty acid desaturase (delta-12 desaturase)
MALYGGPYFVNNMWLMVYAWLHHTHEDVPHYDETTWSWIKGALSTMDRNYPAYINCLHYNIGSTHVVHHLFSYLPHYNAPEATLYVKKLLGDAYNYDERPILEILVEVAKFGAADEGEKGVYNMISKFPYYDKEG